MMFSSALDAKESKKEKKTGTRICSVSVEQSGDDSVGTRLALAVKERIKASGLFRLVENGDLRVLLVSQDLGFGDELRGTWSAVSIVFLGRRLGESTAKFFITNYVSVVGAERISPRAESIVADLDKQVSEAPYPYRGTFCVSRE